MRRLLRVTPASILGAVVGGLVTYLASLLSGEAGLAAPLVVLPTIATAIMGLTLGSGAATYCYVAATAVALVSTGLQGPSEQPLVDSVRLSAFLLGIPLLLVLVYRAETARELAQAALDASAQAEARVRAERAELEAARGNLDEALWAAERDRARLEEVAEAIPEPLVVYDEEGRGTYGNRAALRLFGRSFIERPLDDWGRTTEPRDEVGEPLDREDWPQIRAQTLPYSGRLILRLPMSGRDLIVDVEGTPIPGGGCVVMLRDVGKEAEERRRLSQFASFVAHELRNPLAVAKARMELAAREIDPDARARTHTSRAHESVDAAIGILERLELYSRAESGRIEAEVAPFDLRAAVEAAVERLRTRGSDRFVRVTFEERYTVLGDRHLSEQAITNLLTNADRYSEPAAAIRIEASGTEPVVLRVIDGGPGVPDEVANRVFRERISGGRGLGLGLYLVHHSMAAQGGSVALEQRRPHAVFSLRWPPAGGAASGDGGVIRSSSS